MMMLIRSNYQEISVNETSYHLVGEWGGEVQKLGPVEIGREVKQAGGKEIGACEEMEEKVNEN